MLLNQGESVVGIGKYLCTTGVSAVCTIKTRVRSRVTPRRLTFSPLLHSPRPVRPPLQPLEKKGSGLRFSKEPDHPRAWTIGPDAQPDTPRQRPFLSGTRVCVRACTSPSAKLCRISSSPSPAQRLDAFSATMLVVCFPVTPRDRRMHAPADTAARKTIICPDGRGAALYR